RHERRGDAGDSLLDRKAVLLQDVDQIVVGLGLLEAELAKPENLIDHLLSEDRLALDIGHRFLLESVEFRGGGGLCRLGLPFRKRRGDDGGSEKNGDRERARCHARDYMRGARDAGRAASETESPNAASHSDGG